jgi:pyruvate dehydrogenase (quinone)
MANAMAQSISAQAAFPGRQVISLSGDGGFTMLMGDFLSLAQLGLPVKVVVFNNSALGFIEIEQKSSGFLDFGTSFKNPNFAAMAEASGVRGIRIENSADVDNGIATALAHIPVRAELERHYDPRQDSVRPTLSADQHRK